ncbi:alpha/beta fold hydrolase [Ruminococcus sp. 5_1_39BFAA]|uniref:alpha/beta fold hydrolase n=1 Tax=Ruminococcus sp. 5_1_39BFAA TaxID=457412 RepID=UPI003565531F
MAKFSDFYFDSSTGQNKIHALKCEPDGQVRAVVQIAHGIAEHIDRYRDFMAYLANNGFVVVGNDHLGHGKTITSEKDKGVFFPEDGWNHVVKDLVCLHDIMAAQYPGIKYVMFGHSMGSFLVRTYIVDYPDKYDMAIISGTGHQGKLIVDVGNRMAKKTIKKNGYDSDGTKLNDLSMGSYLKKIESPRTPCDWLSRDTAQVDKYMDDELCGFTARAGLYGDMLKGVKYVTNMSNISRVDPNKPIYFMSGSADPVGDYGKGVKKAYECFQKAGVQDVSMKLYDGGRHEMLNEINRDEVYKDILTWLNKRI